MVISEAGTTQRLRDSFMSRAIVPDENQSADDRAQALFAASWSAEAKRMLADSFRSVAKESTRTSFLTFRQPKEP